MNSKNKSRSSKPSGFRYIKPFNGNGLSKDERKKYKTVGRLSYAPHFYKYLNLDTALKCIMNDNLQFVEPSRWQDKYERRFYTADYSSQNVVEAEDCPILFATCMTTTRSNEAAWKLYTYGQVGLGAYCVEFQINKKEFRKQLVKALGEKDIVYEGIVMYCSPSMIDNIHRKEIDGNSNKYYQEYVIRKHDHNGREIPYITNFLNLLLMKRDAFKHENETRFFIQKHTEVDTSKEKPEKAQLVIEDEKVVYGNFIRLSIDWVDIIEKVYINAKEESNEYKLLSGALKEKLDKKYDGVKDPKRLTDKQEKWDKQLKPEPFFIYGMDLDKRLEME